MKSVWKGLMTAAVFVALIGSTSMAEARDKKTPESEMRNLNYYIDQLEKRHPEDQAMIFKLRATANNLYNHFVTELSNRKPSFSAEPTAARLNATRGDPDKGATLYDACRSLRNNELRAQLRDIIDQQVPVGYQEAQRIVFEDLDNHDGYVECVYTGRKLKTSCEPNATDMNIEHTWPQSQGATGDAKCDLHHLFPTDSKTNNLRSSFPLGNVSNPTWEQAGSKFDGSKFEVRKEHRGNVARAMFYFSVRYGKSIGEAQEKVLRQWHKEDPVDADEKKRCDRIQNFQHNRNAFVDHPEYVDSIQDF